MTNTLGCAEAIVLLAAGLVVNAPARAQGAPPQGSFLEVDGAKLYYEECGSAPHAVVLVHDGVLHSAAWDDVWQDFCKHFHALPHQLVSGKRGSFAGRDGAPNPGEGE